MTAEQIQAAIAPVTDRLPSQRTPAVEVLPPLAKLETRFQFADAVRALWVEAEGRFLDIGRHLNQAKERLAHGEFMAMVSADLPFGQRTANMLMRVAAAIDGGVLPVERLPASYATVHELLTLDPEERRRAMAENIIRPDMRRAELLAWKRRQRRTGSATVAGRSALEDEEQRLLRQIRQCEERLAEVRRLLGRGGPTE